MLKNVVSSWRHNKKRTLFVLLLTYISFFLCMNAVTNSFAGYIQMKSIKSMFRGNINEIYRVGLRYVKDEDEFGNQIFEIKKRMNEEFHLICGGYEETGETFDELVSNEKYLEINRKYFEGTFYEEVSEISQIVFCDPEVFEMIHFGLESKDLEVQETEDGKIFPIYVGSDFKESIEIGQILTLSRTKERYKVVGYLDDEKWFTFHGADNMAFPLESMNHTFMAPFCDTDQTDSLTQLCTLGNIFVSGDLNEKLIGQIMAEAEKYDIKLSFRSISDLMKEQEESDSEINEVLFQFAGTVIFCTVISIISLISAIMHLNKREYGIRIAFGSSKARMIWESFFEYGSLCVISIGLAYCSVRYNILNDIISEYMEVRMMTLNRIAVWIMLGVALLMTLVIVIPQAVFIKKYDPCELMREDT